MRITHVVNPVLVGEKSDLYVAQPVTFKAMFAAKRYAIDDADVELTAVCYCEDTELVPPRFKQLPLLNRSVLDVGQFESPRKLPLIADILESAVANTDADYFIYTNVDISPMPYFYSAIKQQLQTHDALVINRRTIRKSDTASVPLAECYSQVGQPHPGFDCFVFSRKQFEKYKLYDACIGANWIGRVIICNLLAHAENPKIVTDDHLTFHLGDDRSWKTAANIPFDTHNEAQVGKLMQHLRALDVTNKHSLLKRSYEEFYLKTKDPDPNRPKLDTQQTVNQTAAVTAPTPVAAVSSYSALPTIHQPTGPWPNSDGQPLRQDPVFIVGHPRSGTSILQSLLATQITPAVYPETHFFSIVRKRFHLSQDRIQATGFEKVIEFIEEKLQLSQNAKTHIHFLIAKNELSPKMLFETLVYDQLRGRLSEQQISTTRWMEKTPDHAEHMPAMSWYYPDAKFVFIVRHPEKAILSRRKHFTWNDEQSWPISKHIERWLRTIESVDEFKNTNPNSVCYVKFEDMVADNEMEIQKICSFLGTPFAPEKIANHQQYSRQQALSFETWKDNTQSPVSEKIAAGVPSSLSDAEQNELNTKLKPYLQRFGYISQLCSAH